jgi:hypothetical protein
MTGGAVRRPRLVKRRPKPWDQAASAPPPRRASTSRSEVSVRRSRFSRRDGNKPLPRGVRATIGRARRGGARSGRRPREASCAWRLPQTLTLAKGFQARAAQREGKGGDIGWPDPITAAERWLAEPTCWRGLAGGLAAIGRVSGVRSCRTRPVEARTGGTKVAVAPIIGRCNRDRYWEERGPRGFAPPAGAGSFVGPDKRGGGVFHRTPRPSEAKRG